MFLDAFDDLMLGYALKKLTGVFEEIMEVSKGTASDKATCVLSIGQSKSAKKIPVTWTGIETEYQMEAEGIEPSSQDNVSVGLYMFSWSFNLDANDEDQHPSSASKRQCLTS